MTACPRDGTNLVALVVRKRRVRHCTKCAGLWLPAAAVAGVVGQVARPAAADSTALRCPDDGSPLAAIHHEGIQVDVCTACGGVWLDQGERERIVRAKRTGAAFDVAGNVATDPDALGGIGGLAGEALGAVFEFIGDALSGL
jgi:Zn-finger nucleic acid-binding protein